ncbi:MAG: type VI secretion system baseplate subunit TssF [Chromatiaceae bacterium]|jgi:type VI secretion system protein ImpG
MDPRLLGYYNQELQFIREMGAEFARDFPKIAGRLGLEEFECADPYVERLLEGFAFLAARVQLKLDAEFPTFTQHLLETVYPHYLAPIPSMAVVQFEPDLTSGDLAAGFVIPRGTALRSILGKGDRTACEYRTAADVTLWPLELAEVKYLPTASATGVSGSVVAGIKAGLRFRLRATAGLTFDKVALDAVRIYLRGGDGLRMRLYEQLLAHALAVVVRPPARSAPEPSILGKGRIERVGFDDGEALLPYGPRSFQGYRLLQEYFAFADRYLFVEIGGIGESVRRCVGGELDLIVLLDEGGVLAEDSFDASYFALFCTPAINLFPKRADRVHLTDRTDEHHLVVDRTRPMDFEVHSVTEVLGFGAHNEPEREFLPFYASHDLVAGREHRAYYTLHREPRVSSEVQRIRGPRSSYIGSEVFIALVDADEAPYRHSLRQLGVATLCTNRDLPLQLPLGKGSTDFSLELSAPVQSVRCVAGPTRPRPSFPRGDTAWRLISHLSLNYLSVTNTDPFQGSAALRELLSLYADLGQEAVAKQVEGVRSVATRAITRRLPTQGAITFARGLEVTVTLDPVAFEGSGVFLLGAVLEQFFTKYVSINSFTETVVTTPDREIIRWPARIGRRHTL